MSKVAGINPQRKEERQSDAGGYFGGHGVRVLLWQPCCLVHSEIAQSIVNKEQAKPLVETVKQAVELPSQLLMLSDPGLMLS